MPLGHAGDEGPHLRDDGGVSGWFSSGGPRVRFLTRYDGEVSEPLVGRQGSRVSMRITTTVDTHTSISEKQLQHRVRTGYILSVYILSVSTLGTV